MKKIFIAVILSIVLTSCMTAPTGVINSRGFSINPFDNNQYNVSWEG